MLFSIVCISKFLIVFFFSNKEKRSIFIFIFDNSIKLLSKYKFVLLVLALISFLLKSKINFTSSNSILSLGSSSINLFFINPLN